MIRLYSTDSYLKSFEGRVVEVLDDEVILDKTAFYPDSGGQPHDTGTLAMGGESFPVVYVRPAEDNIAHRVGRPGLVTGDLVRGEIDWERRHLIMRSHTACHLLSAVIFQRTGAMITGNQIGIDRSRVDFSLQDFDRSDLADYVETVNEIIRQDRAVSIRPIPREEAMEIPSLVRLVKEVPDREVVRGVEVEGIDLQACGGTHVQRTGEIGRIKMLKAENKGKANRRVYFEVQRGD